MRRFHAARAARCRRCAPTTARWSRARPHPGSASGSTRPGSGASRSSWPTRPACSSQRRAGAAQLPECAGLAHPASAGSTPPCARPLRELARDARRAARQARARGRRTASARRWRIADDARLLRRGLRDALFTDKRHAAQAARRPAARRPRCAARSSRIGAADRASTRRTTSTCAWCGCRARCSPSIAALQARARPGRHGRPRARARWRCWRDAHARRLGAGAARRAHAPPADRRVPGHQPAAVACAARLAVGLCRRRRRRAAAPQRCSSSATRSRASTASAAPSRACSRRRSASSSTAWAAPWLACDHTRRNARRRCWRPSTRVFGEPQAEGGFEGFRAHTTEVAADGERAVCHAAARAERDTAATRARHGAEPSASGATRLTDAAPRARGGAARGRSGAAWRRPCTHWCTRAASRPARSMVLCPQARIAAPGRARRCARCTCPMSRPRMCALAELPEVQDLVAVLDVLASPGARPVAGAGAEEPAVRCQRRRPAGAVAAQRALPAAGGRR